MQEVGGSIPPGSTIIYQVPILALLLRLRPHRLVGLGHRPFTATTGVRIPLGTPYKKRLLRESFFVWGVQYWICRRYKLAVYKVIYSKSYITICI